MRSKRNELIVQFFCLIHITVPRSKPKGWPTAEKRLNVIREGRALKLDPF
jgi:hypothetical protein